MQADQHMHVYGESRAAWVQLIRPLKHQLDNSSVGLCVCAPPTVDGLAVCMFGTHVSLCGKQVVLPKHV